MNIQSGTIRNVRPLRPSGSSVLSRLGLVFRMVMIFSVFGGILYSYIKLNQKISETDRKIQAARRGIHDTEREIENLRLRREALAAWPHIRDSIAKYDLKLRQPNAPQVRTMVLRPAAAMRQMAMLPAPARTLPAAEPVTVVAVQNTPSRRVASAVPAEPALDLGRVRRR